jgi:membrane protein DedA with SNARE-associated domain
MDSVVASLASLPSELLYPIIFGVAFIENLVPPFPADVTVAFGAFVAAQGKHRMLLVYLSAWAGSVSGAMFVYWLSRRHGAARLERQIAGAKAPEREAKFHAMFARYGLAALFVARFVPGVRAVVPVAAGALKLPAFRTTVLMALAAAIWYGAIVWVAYRFSADWGRLREGISEFSKTLGIAAVAILALGLGIWALVRKRQSSP